MTPQEFIDSLKVDAIASSKLTKIPASFTIAEAALESGWGSSQLAVQGHNLFGVKADSAWHGDTMSLRTREFLQGRWTMVAALWRKYPSWFGSINDHAQFLITNRRYHAAFLASNVADFTTAVAAAGYATDPLYASKIMAIVRQHNLELLDKAS